VMPFATGSKKVIIILCRKRAKRSIYKRTKKNPPRAGRHKELILLIVLYHVKPKKQA
jgi:hypothetical protein